MNCPKCNSEMIMGFIQSGRGIIWSIKKHKITFLPNIDNGDAWVEKENLLGAYKEAFRCPQCETIVMPKQETR